MAGYGKDTETIYIVDDNPVVERLSSLLRANGSSSPGFQTELDQVTGVASAKLHRLDV
jgi:hypothetical protein